MMRNNKNFNQSLSGAQFSIIKISSFEIVDLNLIKAAARQKREIILSTGMANLNEIDLINYFLYYE